MTRPSFCLCGIGHIKRIHSVWLFKNHEMAFYVVSRGSFPRFCIRHTWLSLKQSNQQSSVTDAAEYSRRKRRGEGKVLSDAIIDHSIYWIFPVLKFCFVLSLGRRQKCQSWLQTRRDLPTQFRRADPSTTRPLTSTHTTTCDQTTRQRMTPMHIVTTNTIRTLKIRRTSVSSTTRLLEMPKLHLG